MTSTHPTVVVLGGGYAGVLCANRLRASLNADEARRVRVRLVNPTAEFHERIRLHEVAAGSRPSAALPLAGMLHPDVEVVLGRAVAVEADRRLVQVAADDGVVPLAYDHLVYAVGSAAATDVPGAAAHAFPVADAAAAAAARDAIVAGAAGQRVVVVGGGRTGVETASEVAERHPGARVELVSAGPLLPGTGPRARRAVERALRRLGVVVREGARAERVEPGRLHLAGGGSVPFDVCLWAASFTVPDLARRSGLATDAAGRLLVDECLRVTGHPEIVGAGDAVRLPERVGGHLGMGCAAALPLGGAAARAVVARVRGEEPDTVSVGYLLQCLSLGRRRAVVQVVRADGTPRPLVLGGRLGAVVKEAVCRLTVSGPRGEIARAGAYWSPRGPRVAAAARATDRADGADRTGVAA